MSRRTKRLLGDMAAGALMGHIAKDAWDRRKGKGDKADEKKSEAPANPETWGGEARTPLPAATPTLMEAPRVAMPAATAVDRSPHMMGTQAGTWGGEARTPLPAPEAAPTQVSPTLGGTENFRKAWGRAMAAGKTSGMEHPSTDPVVRMMPPVGGGIANLSADGAYSPRLGSIPYDPNAPQAFADGGKVGGRPCFPKKGK